MIETDESKKNQQTREANLSHPFAYVFHLPPTARLNETEAGFKIGGLNTPIKPRGMQDMRLNGSGPPYSNPSGRHLTYLVADVDEWLRASTVRSTAQARGLKESSTRQTDQAVSIPHRIVRDTPAKPVRKRSK